MQSPDQQTQPDGKNELTFQFSKSTPQGSGSWMNGNRVAISFAMAGTLAKFIDGKKSNNLFRKAASVTGIYANIMEMIFSDKINPIVGELSIIHEDWKYKNGDMTYSMQGKLPKRAESEIERLVKDANLPKDSLKAEYNKKENITIFKIADDLFPILQDDLKKDLQLRQDAVKAIQDDSRLITEKNGHLSTSIKLDGLNKSQINTIQSLLDFDFDIKTNMIYKEHQTVLEIDPNDVKAFHEARGKSQSERIDHLRIKSGIEETYAPGFIETLFKPWEHPKQHGILIGALVSNILTTAAGATENKANDGTGKGKEPWESVGGVLGVMSYLIDFMPEVKKQNNRIFSSNDINLSPTTEKFNEWQQKLDERPLLAGMVFKPLMVASRVKAGLDQTERGEGYYKLFASVMNGCRAVVTSTLQKGDYGRNA